MITPRAIFRADKELSKGWQDRVDSKQFEAAVTAALAEYTLRLPFPDTMASASAQAYGIQGARHVLEILMNLMMPEQPAKASIPQNLDHRV